MGGWAGRQVGRQGGRKEGRKAGRKGREGKGREGKGREGKGREGKGRKERRRKGGCVVCVGRRSEGEEGRRERAILLGFIWRTRRARRNFDLNL